MTGATDASYTTLAPGGIPDGGVASTVEATPSIMVDIDADRRILGVEVIGDGNWVDGLAALAMTGRLAVLPPDGRKPEMSGAEFSRRMRVWALRDPRGYEAEILRLMQRAALRNGRPRLD
jgi:uncharacterized protein YuzE